MAETNEELFKAPSLSDLAEQLRQRKELEAQYQPSAPDSGADVLSKALLSFAPILGGYALGGAAGGAAGAQAGQVGMSEFERQKKAEEIAKSEQLSKIAKQREKLEDQIAKKQAQETDIATKLALEQMRQRGDVALQKQKALSEKELIQLKGAQEQQLAAMKGETNRPKEGQFQAAVYAQRLEDADKALKDLSKTADLTSQTFSLKRRFLPEIAQGEAEKLANQAEKNFLTAILRRESGASISPTEFETAEKVYFPRPGDSPAVLKQKEESRQVALQGLKNEAGPAYSQLSKGIKEQRSPKFGEAIATEIDMAPIQQMTREQKIQYLKSRGGF